MTALPRRRRRSTLIAIITAVVVTLSAAGLAVAGGLTLYNSTEGTSTARTVPERVFPATPTAALAAVDADGELASLAVLVGAPGGTGGSIVTVPVNADAAGGGGDERLPLDETFRLEGETALQAEVEVTLGLGMDALEVVDEARLVELLEGLGPVDVDLPDAVTDADGRVIAPAGERTLEPAEAAAVLTARDPEVTGGERYREAVAVWDGVAAKAGAGVELGGGDGPVTTVLGPLLAGSVRNRSLGFDELDEESNPRQVDVVRLDRIELALVFGQIAPGKISAPNPALTFRIESPFDDAAVPADSSRAKVAYDAISVIVFAGGNVVSVSTEVGEVPPVTQVLVSDDSLIPEVENVETLLGPVEIGVAEERIAGIDAVVRLGSSFLDHLATTGSPEAPEATLTTEADD